MFCYLKNVFATILTILVTITFYNLTSSHIKLVYAAKYHLWLQLRGHFESYASLCITKLIQSNCRKFLLKQKIYFSGYFSE